MPQSLNSSEIALIATATATIDAVPRFTIERRRMDHSVGCAALTSTGRIFTGINVFHFSGGPCAENIAFGNAAAAGVSSTFAPGIKGPDGQAEKIIACVAVWNDKRGVISPCGRCRQMMLDYYPGVRVIVQDPVGGLVTVGIDELLPYAYTLTTKPFSEERGTQVLEKSQ
ncbi:related to cytidine deaminase [Rhynchosporium agropyri]|uniref:Related to cytidine deaminase n=1 Tax=Rhynchosporium agropyri TaxID=914238 RepID=A0A1E1KU56_9HELO|nr:related to cytidine deaminase [Rhynchosporium agropyri]